MKSLLAEMSTEELIHVGRILMGAAHADGRMDSTETMIIKLLLNELSADQLPREVIDALASFNPRTFQLAHSCNALNLPGPAERRLLLALIAEVVDADEIVDMAEDRYLLQVAHLIGAAREEYDDLVLVMVPS